MRLAESVRHLMRARAAYVARATALLPGPRSQWHRSRSYWESYARFWSPEVESDDPDVADKKIANELLGDEWGNKDAVTRVVQDFIVPYVDKSTVAGELGSGGGRISVRVAPLIKTLHCFDISTSMLKRARAALRSYSNVEYHFITAPGFGCDKSAKFDFFYSFDVLVHVSVPTIWQYFAEVHRVLKPGGRAFLHTTNLASTAGWENFRSQQADDHPYCHHWLTPETVDVFSNRAGLRIIQRSEPDPSNFYLNRDYLFVLEKP